MKRFKYTLTILVSSVLLAACGGPPANNPLLKEARTDYQSVQNDPQVVANAPVELKKAEKALDKGEALLKDGADADMVNHYAYLAKQRTQIAKEKARLTAAEEKVEQAELERKEVLLAVREAEAERSKREAQQAKVEAKMAEETAEAATEQALEAERKAAYATREAREKAMEAEVAKAAAKTAIQSARELANRVAELEARETKRGLVVTLSDILFEFDKATLKPGADRTLNELVSFLNEYENRNLLIEGFTDSIGSEDYNQDLSQRRANAVRQALIAKGVDQARIRTRGLGEEYPVATNDTDAGRQQNRRVEIVISDETGEIPDRSS